MILKIVIFLVKIFELLGKFKTNIANSRKKSMILIYLKLRLGFGLAVVVTEVVVVDVVKLELLSGDTAVDEPNVNVDVGGDVVVVPAIEVLVVDDVITDDPKVKLTLGFSFFLSAFSSSSSSSSKAESNFSTRFSSRLLSCSSFSGLLINTVLLSSFSLGSFTTELTMSEIFGTIIFCVDLSVSSRAKATFLTGPVDVPLSRTFRRFFFC